MNSWNDENPKVRQDATRRFCEMLDSDSALREACKNDPEKARATLQKAGDFDDMPADLEVRVFEDQRASSDQLVTMILPPVGELPSPEIFDARSVWRCTWISYA